jgi:hypothetical protein
MISTTMTNDLKPKEFSKKGFCSKASSASLTGVPFYLQSPFQITKVYRSRRRIDNGETSQG